MTSLPSPEISAWYDPHGQAADPSAQNAVTATQLVAASVRVLSEPLVAQRLINAKCLTLLADGTGLGVDLLKWGHTFASAVATLVPPCGQIEPRHHRERRRRQEQILADQQRWPDLASVTSTAYLLCADHKPPEYGLAPQLYPIPESGLLIDWGGFQALVDRILYVVSPVAAPAWLNSAQGLREALTTIIAETVKNTHDHARTEVDGASVSTSVRGLYARFYPMSETAVSIDTIASENRTQAEKYVRSFIPNPVRPGVRPKVIRPISGFLEISVIDSGPGMAARWRRQSVAELPPKDQGDAVVACFRKGLSTTGSTGRGFGLRKVLLSIAQLKGLISIRTNGVHLFRQFGYVTGEAGVGFDAEFGGPSLPSEQFLDWRRGLSTAPSEFPHVKGTVVSFLLPMGVA